MRKPFYKKTHGCWYVVDNNSSKHIRLDPDEETAFSMWRQMVDANSAVTSTSSYTRLLAEFLEGNYEDKQSFEQDAVRMAAFAKKLGTKQAMNVTKRDVVEWLNEEKDGQKRKDGTCRKLKWGQRTKKDAYNAIMRVYRWAIQEGIIPRCPFAGLKIAAGKPRSTVITPAQNEKLLSACDPEFRDYLNACACGPRPRQVREVTAENVLSDYSAWVFQDHKTAHLTDEPLVVYLPPELQEITKRLVKKHPEGPLFRNSEGNPWKKDTVGQKFRRIRDKLGLPKNIVNYSYRHTFATEALVKELPIQTVAELLGHKDTRMVSKVYGHLSQNRKYLANAAARARGASAEGE